MKKILFLIIVFLISSSFAANAEKELQELSGILKKKVLCNFKWVSNVY